MATGMAQHLVTLLQIKVAAKNIKRGRTNGNQNFSYIVCLTICLNRVFAFKM